ncbi:hypothetical protein DFH08DRAFT_979337 [Mycena albidolilacea]|uniref:Uncharacterized protein n=1 Tax=Mycena albidolilacea TaxID=1033008 RepID=A0AAD7E6D1_9AGAR|nr:hypothetical protein DFH08DRAFT_979337 [Mycena albidolilacea]
MISTIGGDRDAATTWPSPSSTTLARSPNIDDSPHKVVGLANAEQQPPKPRTERDRISPTHRKGNSQSRPPGRAPFGSVPNPSDSSHNQLRNDRGRDNSTSPTPESCRPGSHTRTAYPLPIGTTNDEEEPMQTALINEDIEMQSQDGGPDNGGEGNPNPATDSAQDGLNPQCPPIPQQDTQSAQNMQGVPDDGALPPRNPFAFGDKNSGAQFTFTPLTEMPTEAREEARQPTHKAENPHRKARPYEQTLSGPEDIGADVSFQRNDGSFDAPIIDCLVALENVEAGFVATLNEAPGDWTLVAFHLGGTQFFEVWGTENLAKAVTDVLTHARLVDEDDVELCVLAANNKRSPKKPIRPPLLVSYDPDRRTWTLGLWKALSRADKPTTGPRLRWAIAEAILTNPVIAKAVERATGAADARPIFDRLLSLARSVDVRFNPHSRHWCAYAKPFTTDAKLWEEVRAAIRVMSLRHNAVRWNLSSS